MEKINYNVEIVEPIGNYGNIICKKIEKSLIDDDGDIQNFPAYVYNVMLKDGSLISDEWFAIYQYDKYGNCIIGFSRSELECSKLAEISSYSYGYDIIGGEYTYRYGAINSNGILAVPPIYDRLSFNNENSYTAYHNGKLGYIDSIDGKHITPIIFETAQPFFENKAGVEFNGKMGYVDRNKIMKNPNNEAEYAIAPKYDVVGDFENGYAEVSRNGEYYFIDEKENVCSELTNQKYSKKLYKNNKSN